jgi:hypothetical protein
MSLHFITSISKEYWHATAKKCITTWNLPGKLTVYIDQQHGDLDWLGEVQGHKHLLQVPDLKVDEYTNTAKVRKFWGKTAAQIVAVRNRESEERIIWIDADVEQTGYVDATLFDFDFDYPVAMMNSNDGEDCWETGVVIFNERVGKLNLLMKAYERLWNDEEELLALWKPYDAQVLGHIATQKGYLNLCEQSCKNINALENTRYKNCLKHWINKDNKVLLAQK